MSIIKHIFWIEIKRDGYILLKSIDVFYLKNNYIRKFKDRKTNF